MTKEISEIVSSLKAERLRRKFSQLLISTLLDVTSVTISRWESGASEPRNVAKRKIAALLNDLKNGKFNLTPHARKYMYQPENSDLSEKISVNIIDKQGRIRKKKLHV